MDRAPFSDLDSLDRDTLLARFIAQREKLDSLMADRDVPEHLSREVVTHSPSGDCCSDCGEQFRQFGEDVSEQLEYILAELAQLAAAVGTRVTVKSVADNLAWQMLWQSLAP